MAMRRLAKLSAVAVYWVALVGVAGLGGLVGHEQGLAGVAVDLLELAHGAVEPQLGLLLVGDDVGGLLLEPALLVLRLGDGLLELDLGVGALFQARCRAWP